MLDRSRATVALIFLLSITPAAGPVSEDRLELDEPTARFVPVCRDAGAGGYEAFPDVCRLADGRLMCVFYAGYGHVSLPADRLPRGGRISACLSADEGRAWSPPRDIFDGPDDDRDPSIAQLAGGRLICTFFMYPEKGSWRIVSDDGGASWSPPAQISDRYYLSSPVRELSDGTLMLGLYLEKDGAAKGAVVTSEDLGDTWRDVVEIDNAGRYLDAETDVIELSNGDILAALRGREEMHWARSADRGRTWSRATSFGTPGHCPYLHRTTDRVIVLAHRLPATSLRYSRDEGATWSPVERVDDVSGAYPSMVNLLDGSVLIVYYEEGPGSNIRARRFRIAASGVEWLPPADDSLAARGAQLYRARAGVSAASPDGGAAEKRKKQPKAGDVETNSIGMRLVLLPAGEFVMGSGAGEEGRKEDEVEHRVKLTRPFWMGAWEVTQRQWKMVMGTNQSFFVGDDLPVETVTWAQAVEFCRRLSRKEGATYRLPTEAEWEYACRAGTTTPFHTGDTISTGEANYDGNYKYGSGEKGVFREETVAGGSLPPNAWGLHDLHGNVWEWCADWYGAYPDSAVSDPRGPAEGTSRIVRGGCWINFPAVCRSANRGKTNPVSWNFHFGFRVVRELD